MEDSEQASKNFTLKELSCRCPCGVMGTKVAFIERLQEFRDLYGKPLNITSAYRCEKHNTAVGGEKDSKHMLGLAVDIACTDKHERYRLVMIAMSMGLKGIGIGENLVHIDDRTENESYIWLYPILTQATPP